MIWEVAGRGMAGLISSRKRTDKGPQGPQRDLQSSYSVEERKRHQGSGVGIPPTASSAGPCIIANTPRDKTSLFHPSPLLLSKRRTLSTQQPLLPLKKIVAKRGEEEKKTRSLHPPHPGPNPVPPLTKRSSVIVAPLGYIPLCRPFPGFFLEAISEMPPLRVRRMTWGTCGTYPCER